MAKVILKGLVPDDSPIYQQALQIGGRLTVPTQKAAEPILKKTTVRPKKKQPPSGGFFMRTELCCHGVLTAGLMQYQSVVNVNTVWN